MPSQDTQTSSETSEEYFTTSVDEGGGGGNGGDGGDGGNGGGGDGGDGGGGNGGDGGDGGNGDGGNGDGGGGGAGSSYTSGESEGDSGNYGTAGTDDDDDDGEESSDDGGASVTSEDIDPPPSTTSEDTFWTTSSSSWYGTASDETEGGGGGGGGGSSSSSGITGDSSTSSSSSPSSEEPGGPPPPPPGAYHFIEIAPSGGTDPHELPVYDPKAHDGNRLTIIVATIWDRPTNVIGAQIIRTPVLLTWIVEQYDSETNEWLEVPTARYLESQPDISNDGTAATYFCGVNPGQLGATKAGDFYRVKVETEGGVGYSGRLKMIRGPVSQITFQSDAALTPPTPGTEFEVIATLRDCHGNIARDVGVEWFDGGLTGLIGDPEEISDEDGKVRAKLVKGPVMENEPCWLELEADGCMQSFNVDVKAMAVNLYAADTVLDISLAETTLLTATFMSEGTNSVPPPDGTPVIWHTTNGSFFNISSMQNGVATAMLDSAGGRRGDALITVKLGPASYGAAGTVQFKVSAGASTHLEPRYLLRDHNSSAQLHITGYPNGTAKLTAVPLRMTVIHHRFDSVIPLPQRVVLDSVAEQKGYLHGSGPTLDPINVGGGANSLSFNGSDDFVVTQSPWELNIAKHIALQAWILPTDGAPTGGERVIVCKHGAFKLSLVEHEEQQVVKFTIQTSTGEHTLLSDPITLGIAQSVQAEFIDGTMQLSAGGSVKTAIGIDGEMVTDYYIVGIGAEAFGNVMAPYAQGHFSGNIDEVIIQAVRTVVFTDANPDNTVDLDSNGNATVSVRLSNLDAPEDAEVDDLDADWNVYGHKIGVSIRPPTGSSEPDIDLFEDALTLRKRQFEKLKEGLSQVVENITKARQLIIEFILEVGFAKSDVEYLASLPSRDEIDYKKTTWAVVNVAAVILLPFARGAHKMLMLQSGKGGLVVTKLYRATIIANGAVQLAQFAQLLEYVYELGEAYMQRFSIVASSERMLERMKRIFEADEN